MLLLLLGIAIKGNFKETFIEQIQQNLDTDLQVKLVPFLSLVNDDINFAIPRSIVIELNTENEPSSSSTKQTVSDAGADLVSSTLDALAHHEAALGGQQSENDSSSVLKYQNLCEVNYFLNERLVPNLQRIVNERDSYLEFITELQQDKDFLTARMNIMTSNLPTNPLLNTANNILNVNNANSGGGSLDANGQPIVSGSGFNDKQFLLDALTTICSTNRDGSGEIEPGTSLVNLSDTQTLMMLFDSIYKEISITNANMSSLNESAPNGTINGDFDNLNLSESSANANAKSGNSFMGDLRSRTLLTNNWNQKIAIELVECKMKLKQLINEM
jgi:hypothetical protein